MTLKHVPHSRPWISESDQAYVNENLRTGLIASGELVAEFENKISALSGSKHVFAQATGTLALTVGLKSLGLVERMDVLLPTYVCSNVIEAVIAAGQNPVLVDVNEFGVIDPIQALKKMTPNTGAVIAAHIFGATCNIESLRNLGVPIIEDACQAVGLETSGLKAGAQGDIGIYSFHATKMLTTAQGGALLTDDNSTADSVRRQLSTYSPTFTFPYPNMTDLQAALGLAQISRLPAFIKRRDHIALIYDQVLSGSSILRAPLPFPDTRFRYVVESQVPFGAVDLHFKSKSITVKRGVDELLHRTQGLNDSDFPNSVDLYNSNVSLPFYPGLSDSEVERVADAIGEFHG